MCKVNYQYISAIKFSADHNRQAGFTLREIDGVLKQIRKGPFFYGCETTIDKRFANIDPTTLVKILGKFCEDLLKNALLDLFLEPTMARLIRWIPW